MTETQMLVLAILAVILIVVGAWLLLRKRQSTADPAAGVEAQPESGSEIPVLAEPALHAETAAELDGLDSLRATREPEPVVDSVPVTRTAPTSEPVAGLENALDTLDQATSRLAPPVESAPLAEVRADSELLERHLEEQQLHDESTTLAQAERIVCFYLLPPSGRRFDGARIKHLLLQSGLLFGEMSLFHRFEEPSGQGGLMFSVLRFDPEEGPNAFDLENMDHEKFAGLAFFLALPNLQAVKGYDMMCSILRHLAAELGADVYDEQMQLLSKQLREHYRHQVIDYRPGQAVT